jgi:hypothetical protein
MSDHGWNRHAGKIRLIAVPGQVAFFGLAVFLMDRVAIWSTTADVQRTLGYLKATDNMWLTEDVRAGLGELARSGTGPITLFFLIATVVFALATVLLWRVSRRAVAAGLLVMGVLTPPYLIGLVVVSTTDLQSNAYDYVSIEAVDFLSSSIPDWHTPARTAVLGAAAMAYVTSLFMLARPATTKWRAVPVPRMVPLLMRHLPLAGLTVTVLSFVAIVQANQIAHEAVRTSKDEYYAGVGTNYLEQAIRIAGTYGVVLAVAGVIALVLAAMWRRSGISAPLLVVQGVVGLPLLLLLLVVSLGTPFQLSGAADEPFPEVLGSGPIWYLPAILTQTSLAAVAYIASVVMLIRGARSSAAIE